MLKTKFLVLFMILLNSVVAQAVNGRTTYQAKIIKPDGTPLESLSVNFKFSVLDPTGSCVLYVENYSAVNMTDTAGLISFALGSGTKSFPSGATTFSSIFDNSTASFPCQAPGIYNPTPSDNRKILVQFNDGLGWQTLPALAINAVPYSMYSANSQDSQKLNNKADTAFVEYSTLAGLSCASDQAIKFNGVSFSCITVGSGASGGVTTISASGTVLSVGGTASAPVIGITAASLSSDGYLSAADYTEFKNKLSASQTQIVNTLGFSPVSGAAVSSQISTALASQTFGGKTASQVSTSVDDTLAASSSNVMSAIVKRDSSGNFTANDIYANSTKLNYVDIFKPSTNFSIRLQAPASLSANYNLTLPVSGGVNGQVLSTNGSGTLSWVDLALGTVTNVSGTANEISSTGGSSPVIGLSNIGTAGTYYKVVTDAKGRVTSGAQLTLSDIITALGYTPLSAASATGTVTDVLSGDGYLSVASSTTTPVLTLNVGMSASTIAAGNDARIVNALQANTTIGGSTSINTSGNLATTGTVSAQAVTTNSLKIYNGSYYFEMLAPPLVANLTWNLPADNGTLGQVLKTDGAGNLSWGSVSTTTTTALDTVLAGVNTATSGTINSTDTVLTAFGKTQAQFANKADLAGATFSGSVTATAFYYTSDRRLKKNIVEIQDPLEKVLALRGVQFDWRKTDIKEIGFIAQEVEKVVPELVQTQNQGLVNELKSVKYGNIVAIVVAAIKEFYQEWQAYREQTDQKISDLEKKNQELELKYQDLRKEIDQLKSLSRSPASNQ